MLRRALLSLFIVMGMTIIYTVAQNIAILEHPNSRMLIAYDDPDDPARVHWIEVLQKQDAEGHRTAIYVSADAADPDRQADLLTCYTTYEGALIPPRRQGLETPLPLDAPQTISTIQTAASQVLPYLQNASCNSSRTSTEVDGVTYEQCSPLSQENVGRVNQLDGVTSITAGRVLYTLQGERVGYDGVTFVGADSTPATASVAFMPNPHWLPFACTPQGLSFPSDARAIMSLNPMQFRFETSLDGEAVLKVFNDQLVGWTVTPIQDEGKGLGYRFTKGYDENYECSLAIMMNGSTVTGDGGLQRLPPPENANTIPLGPVHDTFTNTTVAAEMERISRERLALGQDIRPELTLQNNDRGFMATVDPLTGKEEYHTFYQMGTSVRYLLDLRLPECSLN
jgi:hypothetical protein